MSEASEDPDTAAPTDRGGDPAAVVRIEPDAAVVSWNAPVPPDGHEEVPVAFRPLATVRAVGARLRTLFTRRGRRRSGPRN
ncbi:hypothetical protein [Halobaculum limi]|uniref:hypothetical protein n=1 Tax=Halobaculum limi TaxID=3031916 RepID=UPI0024049C68|nr:hypothetical protein [Halobaculum sp. YSMS11]